MTRNILYLLIAIMGLSCEKHEVHQQSEFELDRTDIYAEIFKINSKSDVDSNDESYYSSVFGARSKI
jgi:hypothetical protein